MTELFPNLSMTFQMDPNDSCIHMNDMLWIIRQDVTTSPLVMTIFAICYAVIIIFGVIGNSCVILSISRTRSLQTVPSMFIFSLSCSDIVVCFTSATITPITAFKKDWIFGSFLCSVAPFIAGVSLCFSTFTLAAISIDRFMLIRYPMKKPFSHFQASIAILLNCLLATILSAPAISVQKLDAIDNYCGQYCYENWGVNRQHLRRIYGTVVLAFQFVIPLTVIMLCYAAISIRLGQSLLLKTKKRKYEWQFQISDQQQVANKRRQRTNRMFIAMVVAFSLSWIWSVLFNLLRDYDKLPTVVKDQEFFIGILTHCVAMTSTVWNPILYALLNLQLRAAFLQLIPTCIRECFCSGISANSLSEKSIGKQHYTTFHRNAINGAATHKSPSNNNSSGTTLLIANGPGIDNNFNEDNRYRGETKYGTLGFSGQGVKIEDSSRQPLLSSTKHLSPNRSRSASCINFSPGKIAPPATVTISEGVHLSPPVRSSSARRKESFLHRDMLSSSRIVQSFRKRKPNFKSSVQFDDSTPDSCPLLPQVSINVEFVVNEQSIPLRCFPSNAHQCQSLSFNWNRDYETPGKPENRRHNLITSSGSSSGSRGQLNTNRGDNKTRNLKWLTRETIQKLRLHDNDFFTDFDDDCVAPVSGTTGNDIRINANADNKRYRSISSQRSDGGNSVWEQLLGGALMVPLAMHQRARSFTR